MSVESNPGLLWFCFTTLCDWLKKFPLPTRPIRWKTKTIRDLVTRLSLLHVFTSSYHWLLLIFSSVLIGRCDYFGFGFKEISPKALERARSKPMMLRLKKTLKMNTLLHVLRRIDTQVCQYWLHSQLHVEISYKAYI